MAYHFFIMVSQSGTTTPLSILIVDDEIDMCFSLQKLLEAEGYRVLIAYDANAGLEILRTEQIDLILSDVVMPDMTGLVFIRKIKKQIPIILMTAFASLDGARNAFKLGVIDYLVKPFNFDELVVLIRQILSVHIPSERKISDFFSFDENPKYREILSLAKKIAKSTIPVLIQGESGVGKEVIARYIVDNGDRSDKQYICINCAAIPETLLESELFGYEKGAFTGATTRKNGKIEEANGGTLFLDEIGDMPESLQAKILRFLEDHRVSPIGSNKSKKVDIRVISATNKDLLQLVESGNFRLDLYHRINGINILLPSLSEMKDSIEPLTHYFLSIFSKKYNTTIKYIKPEVISCLKDYKWDGNIREFKNCIERCVITSENNQITLQNLPDRITSHLQKIQNTIPFPKESPVDDVFSDYDNNFMKKIIIEALTKSNGNREAAAKLLKISRKTLYTRIKELNISNLYR